MRVLIIGGTGLIGRATIEKLNRSGAEIAVVSRRRPFLPSSEAQWLECDVLDHDRLLALARKFAPDAVLHLAALLQFACDQDPATAIRVNVDGTLHVLEVCRALEIPRVVFGSSIAVYGRTDNLMVESNFEYGSTGLYGVTKLMCEALGSRYQAVYGLKFVALRYSGVFGFGESDDRTQSSGMSLVRKEILRCAEGRDVVINGASGEERIHLTHASDAAEATCRALLHLSPSHSIYNVAGPSENYVSLQELHDKVRFLVPSAGSPQWQGSGKSAGPVDTSRIEHDLGFTPSVGVIEGLRQSLASYCDLTKLAS